MNLKKYQQIITDTANDLIEDGYTKDDIDTFRETAFLMLSAFQPEMEEFLKKVYGPRVNILDIVTKDIHKQITGAKNGYIH